MNHVIAKTVFNVTIDKSLDGFAMQQELSNLFWQTITLELNRVFDNLDLADKDLIINRLEIDLGAISGLNWQHELPEKLTEALLTALEKLERSAEKPLPNPQGQTAENQAVIILHRERLFDAWLYFLKTGTLPPSVSTTIEETTWRTAIAETLTLSEQAEHQFIDLIKTTTSFTAQAQGVVLERLVLQYDEPFLAQIAAILTRSSLVQLPEWRLSFLNFLEKQGPPPTAQTVIGISVIELEKEIKKITLNYSKSTFWILIFQKIIAEKIQKTTPENLILVPFESFFDKVDTLKNKAVWFAFFKKNTNTDPIQHPSKPSNIPLSVWIKTRERVAEKIKINALEKSLVFTEKEHQRALQSKALKKVPLPKSETTDTSVQYIQQAGIVLTHAFLPMFFNALKLLNAQKQFKNEQARHRAIHLIQYLASGVEGLPEYRLLLPKLLCGLSFDVPLERAVVLKKKEKVEAEALLKAVIKHWGAIGNASPQALREGFFNRDAKLSQTERGRLLQIEQRTEDILLSRLPWSISMIKLPWMQEMLLVEWV
jgi:Contractile injection system tape measure protein